MKRLNPKIQDWKDTTLNNNESRILQDTKQVLQWSQVKTSSNLLSKRAHHSSAIVGKNMYVYGGYEAGGQGILSDFMCFNLQTNQWKQVLQKKSTVIGGRQSHSLVAWNNKLILYGGLMNSFQSSNKLYSFELDKDNDWKEEICSGDKPPGLSSHKAVIYGDCMILISGQQQDKYNQFMYSLDLSTKQWAKICKFTKYNLTPRSDFSLSLYNNKLYLFGGKSDDVKYNQLWQYAIDQKEFKKIENNQNKFWPVSRSGHCSCVYKGKLIVFGGTTGVTHQRNDLLIYDIEKNQWQRHWPDEQSQLNFQQKEQQPQQSQSRFRSSPTSSLQKKPGANLSQFSTSNQNQSCFYQQQNSSTINKNQQPKRKYRQPMKNQNYYNQNYPFYGDKQSLLANKHKKNDLLVDLEKQTKQEMKHHQGLRAKTGKINLHMSQTFQSITNTMLATVPLSQGKAGDLSVCKSQQKSKNSTKQVHMKQPKSRDGHSCEIFQNKMIIFGGDRHHMSFNDVIIIDLDKVLMIN